MAWFLTVAGGKVVEDRSMEVACRYRPWDSLMPETLGLIFQKLPLEETLGVVPRVCKAWASVVRGPYCWHEVDIGDWSRYCLPEDLDRMLQMIVSRSCGSLRKLRAYGLSNGRSLSLIADHAKGLLELRLPRSDIRNPIVEELASKFSTLTLLDLSYCTKIRAVALRALGKHCKFLTTLLRNMHPWDVIDRRSQDDEALAIATTMPNLRHLELSYLRITTEGVVHLITGLHGLELLDVRGCWTVKLEDGLLEKVPGLKVVGPLVPEGFDKKKGQDALSSFSQYFTNEMTFEDDAGVEENPDGDAWDDLLYSCLSVGNVGIDWPQPPWVV